MSLLNTTKFMISLTYILYILHIQIKERKSGYSEKSCKFYTKTRNSRD